MATELRYATSHITGNFLNPNNANGDTLGTWAGELNSNSSYTSRWAIANPVNPLTPSATQTVRVIARKGTNSNNPTIQLNLWENGVLVQSMGVTGITNTVSQTVTGTFNSSAITNPDDVEIEVIQTGAGGSGSARNCAQISRIEWTADTSPAATNLVIANTQQAQITSFSFLIVFDPVYNLAVQNSAQGQVTENVSLTLAATELIIQDGQQTQSAENVTLEAFVPPADLVIADSQQSQITENVNLSAAAMDLVIQGSQQAQTTESVTLVLVGDLQVQNSSQMQVTESVTLTPDLIIQDSQQVQATESVTLALVGDLQIQDSQQTQTTESVILVPVLADELVIQNGAQVQVIDNVTFDILSEFVGWGLSLDGIEI